jgi:hypothetical protein
MLKFHEAPDESTLHFRQHRTNALLLLADPEELAFDRLVELVEVGAADRVTHRDENIHARFDQNPLIDGHKDLALRFRFIGQNPRRQGRRAVEPVWQESEGTLESPGHDPFHALLLGENLEGEQNFEINVR